MTALWQTRLASFTSQMNNGAVTAFRYFSRPTIFSRLKKGAVVLLCLWIALSLWTGLWSFFPEAKPLPQTEVINPVTSGSSGGTRTSVDIEALAAAHLFGEPGTVVSPEALAAATGRAPAMSESEASVALAGIEDGAPDTRLPLLLKGVLAASEAGLGQAVIEHRNAQDLYQVGDELPVSGEVVLAKVLPALVVLDNGGRYEVLRLFEDSELSASVATASRTQPASTDAGAMDVTVDAEAAEIASAYRERLYRDPQSLVEVVRVAAVREGDQLRGYRVSPGNAADEFSALGFQSGDLVTAINGMSLTDPANTVRLYQAMRSAKEAVFELQRKGESVTLNVDLGASTVGNGS
ncbi:type II secretion system protein GspC [Congregibacter litoralis]|uniref:Type II secretion system protein C (GspC) n=1 Tax=Congregibacter litoralis KT71 TaxID=314285 RepID=A4A5J6_9GAMM|nr:type II secretion system protein GspC [Congregibacter litoralis]EAQ99067.2 type II secretion system protein C (GspC) [Congregibacter litoralis KT71]